MPSPRTSPALRPSSPLSTGYKTAHFDTLQPPSPRATHSRPNTTSWRAHRGSLKLPGLPRYHPANYASSYSSLQNTPDGQSSSPQPPTSPRAYQKLYSDAQKQLFSHQRGMVSAAQGGFSAGQDRPMSPRLAPLGSPGPVTPLALEHDEGYLLAGARNAGHDASQPQLLVDSLIREETRRQRQADQGTSQPTGR
jgi:hypothetical protein